MIKGFKKFCLCLLAAGAAGGILAGCNSPANRVLSSRQEYAEQMQAAVSTPFGAYPETVVYTLGKMISTNNSNMPAGDTYEDNAYTRYIKEVINVQNRDVFEEADKQYDTNVSMAIAMNELPDIMLVSNYEDLETLIENDMIEDLTVSYQNCISDRIREMYASYGEDLIDSVTFDGKIMALPETNITDGPNLVWLRKDWMDTLGLSALVEAHDEAEIAVAVNAGARLIGVNNRNLKDFTVDTNNSRKMRELVPSDILFVSESGVKDADDIKLLREAGADAVLIGETLMRADNKTEKLAELKGSK